MRKILYIFLAAIALLSSCATNYNIQGSSSINTLDGRVLYLKALKDQTIKNIDSCDVVHGKFHFSGTLDTVRVARLFMDDESILPVVLEKGEITINIGTTRQTVGGTPLNDTLFTFMDRHNQIQARLLELSHRQSQMIMDGIDVDEATIQLNAEAEKIALEEEKFVTQFIEQNFDNVLGPFAFMLVTGDQEFPMLTPWIDALMSKATDAFLNDEYVKAFYETAQENQQRMNGMIDENTNITSDNSK